MKKLKHFLIVFDHSEHALIDVRHFDEDSDAALSAYAATEQAFRERKRVEIVLIGSDSFETVQRTHANYFGDVPVVSPYLIGI